ncbi:hypothetical protein [Aquabacterium sp.]|uniref:hypothetical protein n=1 Tax=Aquabacterium sp. TaxID=1872578 RepID=UPI0037838B5B
MNAALVAAADALWMIRSVNEATSLLADDLCIGGEPDPHQMAQREALGACIFRVRAIAEQAYQQAQAALEAVGRGEGVTADPIAPPSPDAAAGSAALAALDAIVTLAEKALEDGPAFGDDVYFEGIRAIAERARGGEPAGSAVGATS